MNIGYPVEFIGKPYHIKAYKAFQGAKHRTKKDSAYYSRERYADRGIEFRLDSLSSLIDSIGLPPTLDHTLDRIDNDGHYEIGNLRWATWEEQARNRRTNRLITINSITKTMAEWCNENGVSHPTACYRIKRGWDEATAVTKPARKINFK